MTSPGHHTSSGAAAAAPLAPTTGTLTVALPSPARPAAEPTTGTLSVALPSPARPAAEPTTGTLTVALPSPARPAAAPATPDSARRELHPVLRRVIYVGGYEILSVLFTVFVLGSMLGHGGGQATLTAILLSTTATIWNYVWNTLFERAERRFGWTGRGVFVRIGHALGYEGGVLIFTIPLVAFMLGVSLGEAFMIEISLLVFFLIFTYVYSWVFDRVVGLPASAR